MQYNFLFRVVLPLVFGPFLEAMETGQSVCSGVQSVDQDKVEGFGSENLHC